uniref:Laminin subunit beta-1 n=1 Tax=Panagrellus redivivus TaxID=6233 RepID=A0A7E4V2G9_PANRE
MHYSKHCLWAIWALVVLLRVTRAEEYALEEEDMCTDRSCYPATGNLLIGRKHRLSASSTCGLVKPEKYCIVSHLETDSKCFLCDSRQEWSPQGEPRKNSHRIENVVSTSYNDRTKNWWQSENGMQNVSVRLDLEAEFHFTHLIMTFRSFRPAAMIIERSSDFGKTWKVYRYFAYDCATTFPDIKQGLPQKHDDIICTHKYSDVAPSTGGEVVYKVISPHIPTENPYADEIANLLKVTNLRINFTKLHTLGDDLLDYSQEIDMKYYYAIYELVVRGSCSCYGHAQRCIEIEDDPRNPHRIGGESFPDMVHGRCQCTHNTMGLNCEQCMDYFNDQPWRPAIGDESNECKRCQCNGHATRCHFDQAVYNASGFTSGGVCDDCAHNTQGKNCEQCKPLFYRDPRRPIYDPYVCLPCQCDPRGSLNDGICEGEEDEKRGLVAGKCYCKTNVDTRNCDRCKNGYWDLRADDPDGCKKCTCNLQGTVNNEGCDKYTGNCTCKALVTGENCDQCLPDHYGLSEERDGCKPCDCDLGGAYNNTCDIITGACQCRPNFTGRRCDTTDSAYYCANLDHLTYEAEHATVQTNSQVETREGTVNRTWTGEGFLRVHEGSNITFTIDQIPRSGHYTIFFRYELPNIGDHVGWEDISVMVVRPEEPASDGPCANSMPADDFLIARLHEGHRYAESPTKICLDEGRNVEIRVFFTNRRIGSPDPTATALLDSIVLVPTTESIDFFNTPSGAAAKEQFEYFACRYRSLAVVPQGTKYMPDECQRFICPVSAIIFNRGLECQCDPTGSVSGICNTQGGQCECKPNVIGRRCDKCAIGTYGFGPEGCSACNCDSVGSLSNNCDKHSGQCECRDRGVTGRQCNECQPGFWSFPECKTCSCHGHATLCDQKTGACIECRNLTDGQNCERCKPGYYGDPRLGVNIPCKACPCPGGPNSGKQHADGCYLTYTANHESSDVVCHCQHGYTGARCDECSLNFWGNPKEVGGSCEKCDCNGNIDPSVEGSCDAKTGDCLKCLHHTEGPQCDNCVEGYFGDAKQRNCQRCVCNELGTDKSQGSCDRITGQCKCFPNVVGMQCDACAPQHFNISSGAGCSACSCDPSGVINGEDGQPLLECNTIDGRCHCKEGRGGRTCSECQDLYWGDPVNGDCKPCECNDWGSLKRQCHRENGTCECRPGSGGPLCNECARGYTGQWPQCQACGECFNNWDRILQGIKSDLNELIERANTIEDKGISSQYDDKFEAMEAALAEVRDQLDAVNISNADVDAVRKSMEELNKEVEAANEFINERSLRLTKISADLDVAKAEKEILNTTAIKLTELADQLNDNATEIRRSDLQGAYDMVKDAVGVVKNNKVVLAEEINKITNAEKERVKAENLLENNKKDFEAQYTQNQEELQTISTLLREVESSLPGINKDVCGGESSPCDSLCGGPSSACSHCGGNSCSGSVTKAGQAIEFAKEADQKISAKQAEAAELLKRVRAVSPEAIAAKAEADRVHGEVNANFEELNQTRADLIEMNEKFEEFLGANHTEPSEVYELADEVINTNIPYGEVQIQELADKIRQKVNEARDTDKILAETRGNKTTANKLQQSAEEASKRAAEIKNITQTIRDTIKKTEEIQKAAQAKLEDSIARLEKIRSGLVNADDGVMGLEDKSINATVLAKKLQNDTDNLKAEYIKITSSSKTAGSSASLASEISGDLENRLTKLDDKYTEVKEQLDTRENGNDDRKERANALRKRTTDLLSKIKHQNTEIESLERNADTIEVELNDYKGKLDLLSEEIDTISKQITQRANYHATCDA